MNLDWTTDDTEARAREALGTELAAAADLFPRLVTATYVQMTNSPGPGQTGFDRAEFKKSISHNLPKTVEETLPFFVRMVWNRKLNFLSDGCEIENLASAFSKLLNTNGGSVPVEELVSGCKASLDEPSGIKN
ncbi:MAG: hypothetical protein ACO3A4_13730 [Silvanigrellaceae bacterium]